MTGWGGGGGGGGLPQAFNGGNDSLGGKFVGVPRAIVEVTTSWGSLLLWVCLRPLMR